MNPKPKPGKIWKPGQSGNPKGRPRKEDSWKNILSSLLETQDITMPDGTKISRKEAIAIRMIQEALNGRVEAANFIGKFTESPEPIKVNPVDENGNAIGGVIFRIKKETLESWEKKMLTRK